MTVSHAVAGLGLGVALASAPGPVQAVILAEAVRGGVPRGLRAMAGANVTFGLLLVALALGLSVAAPTGTALRILKIVGGAFLLFLAADGLRANRGLEPAGGERRTLPPAVRGSIAVLLNPGAWIFLGTAASSLFATATESGGTASALVAAVGLVVGLAMGDGAVAMLGGFGVRRGGDRVGLAVRRILGIVLAGLGLWLLIDGSIP